MYNPQLETFTAVYQFRHYWVIRKMKFSEKSVAFLGRNHRTDKVRANRGERFGHFEGRGVMIFEMKL